MNTRAALPVDYIVGGVTMMRANCYIAIGLTLTLTRILTATLTLTLTLNLTLARILT